MLKRSRGFVFFAAIALMIVGGGIVRANEGLAEFAVTGWSVPASPGQGSVIEFVVTNVGGDSNPDVDIWFYELWDSKTSTSQYSQEYADIGDLGPRGSSTFTYELKSSPSSYYYLNARIDYGGGIYKNHFLTVPVSSTGSDLAVVGVAYTPAVPSTSETVTFDVTIENIGTTVSTPYNVKINVYARGGTCQDVVDPIETQNLKPLQPGQSRSFTAELAASKMTCQPTYCEVECVITPAAPEGFPQNDNNTATFRFPLSAPKPDLSVSASDVRVSLGSGGSCILCSDKEITIEIDVKNIGDVATPVAAHCSGWTSIGYPSVTKPNVDFEFDVPILQPKEVYTHKLTREFDSWYDRSRDLVGLFEVHIDDKHEVDELTHSNNSLWCPYPISLEPSLGAPVLSGVPADETVTYPNVPPIDDVNVTATGDCGKALVVKPTETGKSGVGTGYYTLERTWVAEDSCGRAATATQHIRVNYHGTADYQRISVLSHAPQTFDRTKPAFLGSGWDFEPEEEWVPASEWGASCGTGCCTTFFPVLLEVDNKPVSMTLHANSYVKPVEDNADMLMGRCMYSVVFPPYHFETGTYLFRLTFWAFPEGNPYPDEQAHTAMITFEEPPADP